MLIVLSTVSLCMYLVYSMYMQAEGDHRERFINSLKEILQNETCNETFGKTQEEDIEKIKSYPLDVADKYLMDLVPTSKPGKFYKGETELPVIVTGASMNHMHEVEALFERLNTLVRPDYPSIKVYFYDLGLTSWQRAEVKEICDCTVISFPFERYPPHVRRLNNYSWKPLIIAMMLKNFQFVLWIDSSIQIQTAYLDPLFKRAKAKGVIAKYDGFLLPSHTHQDTYKFLGETPCVFRESGEFSASFLLFHTENKIIRDYLIKPWVACALIEDCMRTKHEETSLLLCWTHKHYHACHRYDQAVFGLLLFRLFHNTYKEHDLGSAVAKWCRELECI